MKCEFTEDSLHCWNLFSIDIDFRKYVS